VPTKRSWKNNHQVRSQIYHFNHSPTESNKWLLSKFSSTPEWL